MAYGELPLGDGQDDDDPDRLTREALEQMQETVPGFEADDDAPETALIAALMQRISETRALVRAGGRGTFRDYGEQVVEVPRQQGTAATGTVVFTMRAGGGTIPAGTLIAWPGPDGPVGFETVVELVVPDGAVTSPPVQVIAESTGSNSNDLAPGPVDVVDSLAVVTGATATTSTGGGTDAETDEEYVDRLADALQLLTAVPVQAPQFATLARQEPGVARALAVDNYDPQTDTGGQERMVAVYPLNSAGQDPAPSVRAGLSARLEGSRETNFLVPLGTAVHTPIAVDFDIQPAPGFDHDGLLEAARGELLHTLSPAVFAGGDERPPVWRDQRIVGYLDTVAVLARVPGVARVLDLTLDGARVDVTLGAHPGVLPDPTVTGTVTP